MSYTSIFTDVISETLPDPHSSLLNGILFGEKLSKNTHFYEAARRVGLLHIVVISGTNITLMGGLIRALTLRIGSGLSIIFTILGIVLFVLAVGADPPITRAAVMGTIALLGQLSGRKSNALYMLFLSGAMIVAIKPEWLSSLSFQLSFVATLGIILFGIKTEGEQKQTSFWLVEYLKSELKTSLAAQFFTVPLIFWYFREISLISPLANIAVSWAIGPVMVIGLIASIMLLAHPILAWPFLYIAFGLLDYIIFIIRFMSNIPFSFISFNG